MSGDRKYKLADVRATLQDAMELLPPKSRINMLYDLLAQASCALIEQEAARLAMRMPSGNNTAWRPIPAKTSQRAALLALVSDNPGITTKEAAKKLDIMTSSCGATLSMLSRDGLVENRGRCWFARDTV